MKHPNIPEEAAQLLGRVISGYGGTYTILEYIGGGATSYVFKSRIESTISSSPINPITTKSIGRIVACKVLLARLMDKEEHYKRFQNEVKVAKRLAHPNIIEVYDAGEIDGRPFMIMDHLDCSLADIYIEEGKLEIHRALPIFLQISDAFSYAHQRSVIHRDLKPSNVMLAKETNNGVTVKIVDFGIAKIIDETTLGSTQLTKTGDVFGTPTHMSPEQCLGGKIDSRSDVYSMGILMYEILAGHLPLQGHSALSTMSKHTIEKPEGLVGIDPDPILTKKMERVIFKCLGKDPNDRYQKMDELGHDLERVQLYSDQVRSGKTNKILCAIERAWLYQSQLIAGICKPVLSKRIKSTEITVGWILLIASTVLVLVAILGWIFLYGLPSEANIADRELPFKPIIETSKTSVMAQDEKLADAVWTKMQSSGFHKDPQLLEQISELFLRVAESCRRAGNYENAAWWYQRARLIIDNWLGKGASFKAALVNNGFAESCLLANTRTSPPNRIQIEQLQVLLRKYGKDIPIQVLRESGLDYALYSAMARDSALAALTSLRDTVETRSIDLDAQRLLAQGLLAESLLEFGDINKAKTGYDQFYDTLHSTSSIDKIDNSISAYLLVSAARFYLQHQEPDKANELLMRIPPLLTTFHIPAQYNLSVVYNDLALAKEKEGKAKEAQLYFSQAYEYLVSSAEPNIKYRLQLLNNLVGASLQVGDYKSALQSKLKMLIKGSI